MSAKLIFTGWGWTIEKAKILISFNGFWPFLAFARPSNGGGGVHRKYRLTIDNYRDKNFIEKNYSSSYSNEKFLLFGSVVRNRVRL